MRSMVEREALPVAVNARHRRHANPAKRFDTGASLSTTPRVVPLSQEGED